ncbi:MAG TPA: hypothetical protein VKU19_16470 [Bryobacteraceae bacterium]|nr:hypothetical protein [Bryobacteraceae bacterium]
MALIFKKATEYWRKAHNVKQQAAVFSGLSKKQLSVYQSCLKTKYGGLSMFQFRDLWSLADGRCVMCRSPLAQSSKVKKHSSPHVEHVKDAVGHLTVWSITCNGCNVALGNKPPKRLLQVLIYAVLTRTGDCQRIADTLKCFEGILAQVREAVLEVEKERGEGKGVQPGDVAEILEKTSATLATVDVATAS